MRILSNSGMSVMTSLLKPAHMSTFLTHLLSCLHCLPWYTGPSCSPLKAGLTSSRKTSALGYPQSHREQCGFYLLFGGCQREGSIVHHSLIPWKKRSSVYYVPAQQNLLKILRRLKVCCHAAIFHLPNASDSFAAVPHVPESMRTSTGDPRSKGGFHPQKKANLRFLMTIHPPLLLHSLVTWPWGEGTDLEK